MLIFVLINIYNNKYFSFNFVYNILGNKINIIIFINTEI